MRLKVLHALLVVASVPYSCLAQRPVAVDAGDARGPDAVSAEGKPRVLTRVKDGFQHPDLDAAWSEYASALRATEVEQIRLIKEKLAQVAETGDLDAALKWNALLKAAEATGVAPDNKDFIDGRRRLDRLRDKAEHKLAGAYGDLVTQLTINGDFDKALAVSTEKDAIVQSLRKPAFEKNRPGTIPRGYARRRRSGFPEEFFDRIRSVLTRPREGAAHASLDVAWKKYSARMEDVMSVCRSLVKLRLEDAQQQGDLVELLRWQEALQTATLHRSIPANDVFAFEAKQLMKTAEVEQQALGVAYDTLVRLLTKQGDLDSATVVRDEWNDVLAKARQNADHLEQKRRQQKRLEALGQ